ncbi:MAG: ribosome maturation factor RimM [Gammaproteobacteria bacterium]|nr:ribosome maturation factor RimM [Gammaproteobacteria bacterium]MBU1628874.1 ribosome maturation factor RimM [Gammaproteobacteria bacterium]MBU1926449.1 ribosome maturation factor RimM [Gammaproteobacteria bacterium]MBU2546379.1 ribosome maturation factor RimM [Gammaproteobacteria bacterium]
MPSFIVVGQFGKPHALDGWIKVHSHTDPAEAIKKYSPWYIQQDHQWQPIAIDGIQAHHSHFIVHIQDVNSPEAARVYVNKKIGVPQDQLPPLKPGEYYWSDLEGLTVFNQDHILLGTIDHLMATKSNDVMVIVGEKRHLIPFIKDQFVLSIDLKKQEMIVLWDPEF